ncbi:MAG: oligosaccharide flippase family protein [Ilumatobacteraceae bacterium]
MSVVEGGREPRRSIRRNILALLSSQVATWGLSTVTLVMLPRYLGPVALGELRVSSSLWAVVVVVAGCGTGSLLTIEVAKRKQQAIPLAAAVGRTRTSAFLALVPLAAGFCFLAGYEAKLIVIITIGGVAAILDLVVMGSKRAALMGAEEMGAVARVDVATTILSVTAVAIALPLGAGVLPIALLGDVGSLFGAILFGRALRSVGQPADHKPLFRGRRLLRAGMPFLFADAMVTIYLQVDTLVISVLVGERDLGWYSTADGIFGSLLFVPAVLMSAVFPSIAAMHDRTPTAVAGRLEQAFRSMLLFGVWIGLGTVLVSRSLTSLLFGAKFSGTSPVLATFGVVAILSFQTILLGQFAIATGRARFIGVLLLVSTVLSLPLDLLLIRWTERRYGNGAIGGALAYIVTELIQIVCGVIVLAPYLLSRTTLARVVRCVVAGAALLAAGWPFRDDFFLVSLATGSVAFFVALLIMRAFDEFELDQARVALRWLNHSRSQ